MLPTGIFNDQNQRQNMFLHLLFALKHAYIIGIIKLKKKPYCHSTCESQKRNIIYIKQSGISYKHIGSFDIYVPLQNLMLGRFYGINLFTDFQELQIIFFISIARLGRHCNSLSENCLIDGIHFKFKQTCDKVSQMYTTNNFHKKTYTYSIMNNYHFYSSKIKLTLHLSLTNRNVSITYNL